jgi:hypothetical protein
LESIHVPLEVIFNNMSEVEWEHCARDFLDYSIYQTCAYQQVRGIINSQQVHRLAIKSDDGELLALCQIRIQSIKAIGLRVGYVQWGPLIRKKNGTSQNLVDVLSQLRDVCFELDLDVVRLAPNEVNGPESHDIQEALKQSGFQRLLDVPAYHTTILSLDPSYEVLREGLHQSWRRMLRKAESSGVEIRKETGQEPFQILQRFYKNLVRKKGFDGVEPDIFSKTQIGLSEFEKISTLVGYCGNQPVTVHATSNLGDCGVFLLSASSDKGYECRASYVAWWRAIVDSKNKGLRKYDTGGIDFEKAPGIARFKAGIGAEEKFYIGTYEAYANRRASALWGVAKGLHRLIKK